jgi:hypothetical protein
MSSNKKNQEVLTIEKVEEVIGPSADEKTTVDLDPITVKILGLTTEQQNEIAQFKALLPMFASKKVLYDPFKAFAQTVGLYETSTNQAEVDALQAKIDNARNTLIAAGFPVDSEVVKGAIKGLVSELTKASAKVSDNLGDLAKYFGVELARKQGERVYAATGELATYRPSLAELKTTDYVFCQSDKKAVVVHSSTIAQKDLDKLGVKAESQLWLSFEYNGEFTFDRTRHADNNGKMIAVVRAIPENWMKVYPVVYEGETLSGLMAKVGGVLQLPHGYNGNGWQSVSMMTTQFDKVSRVVKEA